MQKPTTNLDPQIAVNQNKKKKGPRDVDMHVYFEMGVWARVARLVLFWRSPGAVVLAGARAVRAGCEGRWGARGPNECPNLRRNGLATGPSGLGSCVVYRLDCLRDSCVATRGGGQVYSCNLGSLVIS